MCVVQPLIVLSAQTFHSELLQVGFAEVTVAFLSALPSSNSWQVPEPSSPGTQKISTTLDPLYKTI